ncbi:MCP four helix bundle domain-containing protein [Comamonas sp. Y33R10-2]|uniref:methyl-accepting chemotaxis protein n=1 Tax=Comamonas sp. Y33R10-2 TaxID=2853257 RepID=UPI001C5CBB4E|nr:methyl-accepting chemotaxis protein [Comamonas sp. Y33R10-2]QXZ10574.1 MCP four helix bundle domain-containing protein [Comamonas sp. Y33R10-2]
MTFFRNLKLAHKLLLSFVLLLAISAVSGLYGLIQIERVNSTATDLARQRLPSAKALQDMRYLLQRYRAQAMQHVIAQTTAEMEIYEKTMPKVWDELQKNQQEFAKYAKTEKERELLASVVKQSQTYAELIAQVINYSRQLRSDEASEILRVDLLAVVQKMNGQINELAEINVNATEAANQAGDELYETARLWVIALLLGAIALGLLLAVTIARSISKPLESAVKLAQAVAGGDLSAQITVQSRDEIGQLLQALKDMNTSLQRIVGQVRQGTDSIASASSQIASGNQDLSSRTEEQASSLEQTAASMEELTSTVQQNAGNAQQANQLATAASQVAVRGGATVAQVVQTMSAINDSSRKIVAIIGVIDSIAFQTNILALNAAVEAARAGDQGRGFAVVASEVRTLAQRSAEAAKQIKQLIDDSVNKVQEGGSQVGEAGKTMDEIVMSVRRVTDIMGEISVASHQQTSGIEQVSQAVMQMDQMTQQNAALVEEAAAATDALRVQAAALAETVSFFKLDAQAAMQAAPALAPASHFRQTPARVTAPVQARPAIKPAGKAAGSPTVLSVSKPVAKSKPLSTTAGDDEWETF